MSYSFLRITAHSTELEQAWINSSIIISREHRTRSTYNGTADSYGSQTSHCSFRCMVLARAGYILTWLHFQNTVKDSWPKLRFLDWGSKCRAGNTDKKTVSHEKEEENQHVETRDEKRSDRERGKRKIWWHWNPGHSYFPKAQPHFLFWVLRDSPLSSGIAVLKFTKLAPFHPRSKNLNDTCGD